MLEVKSSLGKHEGDIPQFDVSSTLQQFMQRRDALKLNVQSMTDKIAEFQSSEPLPVLLRLNEIFAVNSVSALPDDALNFIFMLEKKFVLKGELATDYSPVEQGKTVNTRCTDIYVTLAAILLRLYKQRSDFNALNSAIRILDKVSQLIDQGGQLIDVTRLEYCLSEEQHALEGIQNG